MIALLLMATVPLEDIWRERCDVIEHNSFYDEQGRLVFDQIIFYDWCPTAERLQVRAWRLVKGPGQIPEYDHGSAEWFCLWHDEDILRHVSAPSTRRTWTQFDPELAERDVYPKEKRRELRK